MEEDVEKKWVLAIIEQELERGYEKIEKPKIKAVKPKSRVQQLLRDIYIAVSHATSPDHMDKFYEENIASYGKKYLLADIMTDIAKELGIEAEYPYLEKEWQNIFFKLCEKKIEEPDFTLSVMRQVIERRYPNLIADIEVQEVPEQIGEALEDYEEFIRRELERIEVEIEKNREQFKDKLKMIEQAKSTKLEEVAKSLNERVILGKEIWKLLLLATLSPFAPRPLINGIPVRSTIHIVLAGDISTGKSTTMRIIEKIAPKVTKFNKITEASFEGVATQDGIKEGILEEANDGVMIVAELNEFSEFPILREALDCSEVVVVKKGEKKIINVNVACFTTLNPRYDFFLEGVGRSMMEQIKFSPGLMSRFILIPFVATPEKIDVLLKEMEIFGDKGDGKSLKDIAQILKTLSAGMKTIKEVRLTEEQKKRVKEAFRLHNYIAGNRPLVILRDLEDLIRIVNVIVASKFYDRDVRDGVVYAKDEDIEEALEIFDTVIELRRKLLEEKKRSLIMSPKERLLIEITRMGKANATYLKELFVDNFKICSKATLYRKLDELVREGKIVKIGERNAEYVPVLLSKSKER